MEPLTHRRQLFDRKRQIRRAISQPEAAAAIGAIEHGMEAFVLNGGKFSLVDVLTHILDHIGPADVTLSTWSAAGADLSFAYKLLTDGRIRSIRFLTDFSFKSRQPAYCEAMVERFGNDAIRITKNHCKFMLAVNDEWHIVIRTSANLNENKRLEYCEVSDDPELAQFLSDFVDEIFRDQDPAGQFERRPFDHVLAFERMAQAPISADASSDKIEQPDQTGNIVLPVGNTSDQAADVLPHGRTSDQAANLCPNVQRSDQAEVLPPGKTSNPMNSTDVRKYYSDEPYGTDLRRVGITYLGGTKK